MRSIVRPLSVAALIVAALVLSACGRSDAEKPPATAAASLSVSLVQPQNRAIKQRLLASGAIAAHEEMQLGVELNGLRIAEVLVDIGQSVKRGQTLLKLDTRTLDSDLAQAEAAVAEAEAMQQMAGSNAERAKSLRPLGHISARDFDELIATSRQAAARAASAKALRDAAALRRSFAELRAPDDGVISRRSAEPGQVVNSGAELLRMIRGGRLEWRGTLPAEDLIRVQEGTIVQVATPDGRTVEGQVRAIAAALDPTTRTGMVYARLDDPGSLRAGMFAQGELLLGETAALVVPLAAIVQRDGHSYVFTVDNEQRAVRKRIETGAVDGTVAEVRSGISATDAVIGRGAAFLSDGDRVRVVPAGAQP
ncbi:efflux RND transporter periplasmic adaptor subunit [Tahibacter amnicola]|uniref:Efflux RND transporter periplasmic adaptor subunit n=1 Tax=Tahibacter amnicola TaxID=2976241 RepID=A0ABY6BCI3_9GAMM|nr:efflux RND transporter periplasmic adaptor subunit [Tahibacter amnicola]UXI66898.1 efflux RND transporter periplasmic adaptor subunit [Tahibacter amnicola]